MTDQNIEKNNPILTFEGKKYNLKDLSDEIKEIVKGLQISDTQIKMHEDTLKLIKIARNSLANKLKSKLTNLD